MTVLSIAKPAPAPVATRRRIVCVGSTSSANSHGRGARGYRYYRLIATTLDGPAGPAPVIDHVDFWLTGSGRLVDTNATAESALVDPFQVRIPLRPNAFEGHSAVDVDGFTIEETTLTATTQHITSPRVQIDVAHQGAPAAPHRSTPVDLTMPADVAIQFDISWDGDCRADTVGEADEHC